ncbi:MAG: type II toxin-antitoxin system YafQ family toxin [Candidatus Handelsmanbacteria bacterium]|nr:type II toxin-antitoxin system YafQ family toxin [Candidatus Handelsmanbacteria bacterium]
MYTPVYTKQFARDLKRSKRQGRNLEVFEITARTLVSAKPLDPIHRNHRLVGNYLGRRDCHLGSDWLPIYKVEETRIVFERMGTLADLFKRWVDPPLPRPNAKLSP